MSSAFEIVGVYGGCMVWLSSGIHSTSLNHSWFLMSLLPPIKLPNLQIPLTFRLQIIEPSSLAFSKDPLAVNDPPDDAKAPRKHWAFCSPPRRSCCTWPWRRDYGWRRANGRQQTRRLAHQRPTNRRWFHRALTVLSPVADTPACHTGSLYASPLSAGEEKECTSQFAFNEAHLL